MKTESQKYYSPIRAIVGEYPHFDFYTKLRVFFIDAILYIVTVYDLQTTVYQ